MVKEESHDFMTVPPFHVPPFQEAPIPPEVDAQHLRDGEDVLAVRDGGQDLVGHPGPELEDPLLVAGRAEVPSLTGERQEILVPAGVAADPGKRARQGALTPADVRRGTFTLSNVGMVRGIGWATPIVHLPQAAILGTGRIEPKPVVRDGAIVIRSILPISLTWDHRIVNGVPVGQFLETLTDLLEHPEKLELGI